MTRTKIIRLLLTPSIMSGSISIVSTFAVLSVASWSYISHYELFYDNLFGRYGLVTATINLNAKDPLAILNESVFNHILTYNIGLIVIAISVGLVVYMLLEGSGHFVSWVKNFRSDVQDPSHRDAVRQDLSQLTLRIFGLVGWAFYLILFSNVIVPTCLLALQIGLDGIEKGSADTLNLLVAPVLLITSLHLHVIFARLCLLRLRLLGGYDVELESED